MEDLWTIAALSAPWLALAISTRLSRLGPKLALLGLSTALVYGSILLTAQATNARLERELQAFDLNKDGFFTPEESTPAQVAAMERFTSDTGRSLAPITGGVFAVVYVLLSGLIWLLVGNVWRHAKRRASN